MFDNIGKDLDEEANKRRAQSFLISLALTGIGVALSVVATWRVVETVAPELLDEEMVEVLIEDETLDDEAPPPPPPPPPPPAAAAEEEEEDKA